MTSLRSLFTPSCVPKRKKQKTAKYRNWFERNFGFKEKNYESVRRHFRLEENDTVLVSLANGRRFHIGSFETPSLEELRDRIGELLVQSESDEDSLARGILDANRNDDGGNGSDNEERSQELTFEHVIGDAKELHMDPKNAGAVFQVASHFNCLEMKNVNKTPNSGITSYECDCTQQGPLCAMACAPGTVYRNYFVNEYGQGGKKGKQIDCLKEMGSILGNHDDKYWTMKNGYAIPSKSESLRELALKIYRRATKNAMSKLKVGVHWETEVAVEESACSQSSTPNNHRVTQVYSSAIPINYDATMDKKRDFHAIGTLILKAAYEATFAVAAIKSLETNKRVDLYLTKIGGGAFGNPSRWIVDAIQSCLVKFEDFPLNVHLVHYGALEQTYVQYLKGSKDCNLISDYITSNLSSRSLPVCTDNCSSNSQVFVRVDTDDTAKDINESYSDIPSPTDSCSF